MTQSAKSAKPETKTVKVKGVLDSQNNEDMFVMGSGAIDSLGKISRAETRKHSMVSQSKISSKSNY